MPGRGEVLIRILGDSSSLDTALAGSTSKLSAFGEALTSPAGLAVAAGVVIAGALFKIGEDFNNAFIVIRRETGATGTDLQKLEGDFKTVVSTVPAKFGDAADAVSKLHMELGLNGAALDKEAEQVLELNRVTGGVLSETVAGTTDLFNNWQISTKNQAGALDELFRASQLSGATIQTLFDDMKASGGVMREMGFSFDDTITIMAGFEKAGLNTQQIIAGMRIGLGHFAKANEEPRAAFQRLVEEIQNAPTRIQGTADAIAVFGKRSGVGLADAIQTGRISFDDLMKGITGGSDTIRKAGEDTMTLGDKWRLLKNEIFVAVQPIASSFFNIILDGTSWIINAFKDAGKWVGDFVNDWENGTDNAGVGASKLKDIVHTVWRVIKEDVQALKDIWQPVADAVTNAWGQITDIFKNGSPALSDAKSQMGELKSAIWDAFKDSPTFIRQFGEDWETGSNKAGVSAGKIKDAVHAVWAWIKQAFADIKGFWHDLSDDWANGTDKVGISAGKLAKIVHQIWDTIKTVFDAMKAYWTVVFEVCAGIIIAFVKFIQDLWTRFGSHLLEHVKTTWNNILDFISGILDAIKGVFDIFAGIFTLDFGRVWNGIKELVSGVWNAIVALVKESINFLSTIIGLGMAVISSIWGYVWGGIKTVVSAVWNEIYGFVAGGVNNVVREVSSLADSLWGLVTSIYDAAQGVGRAIINGIIDAVKAVGDIGSGIADGVLSAIKGVINPIISEIESGVNDAIDAANEIPFVDIGHIHIPRLAAGGVVANPTLAVIGDAGPGNPEIVTPEKLMRKIVHEELNSSTGSGGTTVIVHGNVYDPQDMHEILDKHDRHMRRRMRTRRR